MNPDFRRFLVRDNDNTLGMSSWESVLLQHKWRAIDAFRYACCAAMFLLSLGLCPDIILYKCRKCMAQIKYVITVMNGDLHTKAPPSEATQAAVDSFLQRLTT
jgi:hypothetical protein